MNYLTRIAEGDDEALFRAEPDADGWCYAYLRSIEKSRRRLVREAQPFDMMLFVVDADRRRRYVAYVRDVECLAAAPVDATSANAEASSENTDAPACNIRFLPDRAFRYPHGVYAGTGDRVMALHRYQMHRAADAPLP